MLAGVEERGVGLEDATGAAERERLFSDCKLAGIDCGIFVKVTLPVGVPSSFSRRLDSESVILSDDFGGMVTCESPRLKMLGLLAAGGRLTRMVFFPAELKP